MAYLFFGPIVAIPLAWGTLSWGQMLLQGIASQVFALLLIHYILESLDYPKHHKRALVEKFALVAQKEVREVRNNTEELADHFYGHFGHFGYYLSLIFFAFTLGVAWAAVIAFALRLKTAMSAIFITFGSIFAFLFWYWVIEKSLHYIAADVAFVVAVGLSVLLLFYGQVREKEILTKLKRKFRRKH